MKRITIKKIKGIEHLSFELPPPGLHVLTGRNGTGKTTLFTCISRICNNNAYRLGFPSNANNTYDTFEGSVTYEIDGESVSYSRRSNGEWRPNRRNSSVFQRYCYPQIINITTKNERVFTQDDINPRYRGDPDTWLNNKLNTIFDTDKFTSMIRITTGDLRRGRAPVTNDRRRNIAYAIPLQAGKYYTEQNFSFGEIVMINLLYDLQNATNGSLILIDELELALHPAAQIRLISCLRELADEKGLTILISTHSSSIIRSQSSVIFLDSQPNGNIDVLYQCPPAKAIGAIGMREDTNPDIIVLVEDTMARSLFHALMQNYILLQSEASFLDVRVLAIGGFQNVANFYIEAHNYIFYDNIYVAAFLDKDVETDVIPYRKYGNEKAIRIYNENSPYFHFLPYTPEVLLVKVFYEFKTQLLQALSITYSNQQLSYSTPLQFDFNRYGAPLPDFNTQQDYNTCIQQRGAFRSNCKDEAERIANDLANQINQTKEEIYRVVFKFAVEHVLSREIDVRQILSSTMKRIRR